MRKIGRWEDGKIGKEDGRMGEWEKRGPGILLSSYPLILLLVTIFNFSTTAQVTIDARLDSGRILIGDQVRLKIQMQASGGALLQAPDLSGFDSLKNIEILDTSKIDTLQRGSTLTLEQTLTITSFDSGFYWLPKIPVNFVFNGKTGIAQSNSLRLEVATIPITNDSIQIAPIKPIIQEPQTLEDFIPFLIPLLILIIIGCIIYLLVKRKKKPKVQPPARVLLPHEIALQKLLALQQQKLWQSGEVKLYQTELTFIIREYLEARFNIPALESTTDEIVMNLRQTDLQESWRDRMQEIFINADLVKFAKAQPPVNVHELGMSEALAFVTATKQMPVLESVTS